MEATRPVDMATISEVLLPRKVLTVYNTVMKTISKTRGGPETQPGLDLVRNSGRVSQVSMTTRPFNN